MATLQEIKRVNGSTVHFVYLPEDLVAELGWVKGFNIDFDKSGSAVLLRRVL